MLIRPKKPEQEGLVEILSEDSVDNLLRFISFPISKTAVGLMIGDLFSIYDELIDWTTIAKADEMLPFGHGEKKQAHKYRWWWLSKTNTPGNVRRKYYWGCWLDVKVTIIAGRHNIEMVRVCESAISVFTDSERLLKDIYE